MPMWYNAWSSQTSEMDCCVSSLSNTLYFLGDSEAGETMKKLRYMLRNATSLSQKCPNASFSSSILYTKIKMHTERIKRINYNESGHVGMAVEKLFNAVSRKTYVSIEIVSQIV